MKHAAIAAMLFASPTFADTCKDAEKLAGDYRFYVMGMFELVKACEGENTKQCRLVRNIDKLAKQDGRPLSAGDPFIMNLISGHCR